MTTYGGDKYVTESMEDPDEVRSKYPEPFVVKLSLRSENDDEISFNPPLYKQRYALGVEFVKKWSPSKLVDFGCAECKFMWSLRNLTGGYLQEIMGVDIDKGVLERNNMVAEPVTSEYLYKRSTPLKIGLYCGSLTQWDSRLEGVEFVSLIEVIEHLEEDILTQLPPAIFGVLKPKYVFVTTPNSEFNILFKNFSGFRHPDHKFEWNRDEFMKWCETICHSYPYQVEYSGVGEPPIGFEEVGYCSQAAFFTIKPEPNMELTPYLQLGDNGSIDWDTSRQKTDQSDSVPDGSPRESLFTDINIPELTETKPEPRDTSTNMETSKDSTNMEPTDRNLEPKFVYKEIICIEFPMQDPNHTPERQLLVDVEYHAQQIAKSEWRLSESQGVREEDIFEQAFESNGAYFEAGDSPGYVTCFVSIYSRLMSYPQIKMYGTYDQIMNSLMSVQYSKLNSELTHYKVELMVEDRGDSDEANSDNCEDDTQNGDSNWDDTFQHVVSEKDFVSVPENWDEETWDT